MKILMEIIMNDPTELETPKSLNLGEMDEDQGWWANWLDFQNTY